MRFYLVLMVVLILQSSVLVGMFGSYLFAPDLLLCFLFLSNLKGQTSYSRGFAFGLLLDILQGSLGWHASGKLLALFLLDLLKRRFYTEHLPFLMVGYTIVALAEHTYRYALFRFKYYYPMDVYAISISFFIELLVVYYFGLRMIKSKDEA